MDLSKISVAVLLSISPALAQGQDSMPAVRNLMIMSEMLPGIYDGANQASFDIRRNLPDAERHRRAHVEIRKVDLPQFGPNAFIWSDTFGVGTDKERNFDRIVTLSTGDSADAVAMKTWYRFTGPLVRSLSNEALNKVRPADFTHVPGCTMFFVRRAGHFTGKAASDSACEIEWKGKTSIVRNEIQLSKDELWLSENQFDKATGARETGIPTGVPYQLERARLFTCYVDMPGVGGGRAVPFTRFDNFKIHDKGGDAWFDSPETPSRRIGISLRNVVWPINNETGNLFNRNSLVLSVSEKLADGSSKEHAYSFAEPTASRVGLNLKWMLANCAIVPRDQARPEM